MRKALGIAAALATFVVASGARADERSDKLAAAEVLFNEGQALFSQGQTAQACDKFQESYNLDPAIGALLNLARCHEKAGRTASAWAEFRSVETLAQRAQQKEREDVARKAALALEPKLSRLTIKVYAPAEGLEITRGGAGVGKAQWGVSMPVDPGDLKIEAKAPKKKPFSTVLNIKPGPSTVDFELPPLEEQPVDVTLNGRSTTTSSRDEGLGGAKVAGLALGGAGIVALGVGAAFQLVALSEDKKATSNYNEAETGRLAKDTVKEKAFNDAGDSSKDAAKTNQTTAIVLASVGVASIVAGVVVFFVVAPKKSTGAIEWAPIIGRNTYGGAMGVRF